MLHGRMRYRVAAMKKIILVLLTLAGAYVAYDQSLPATNQPVPGVDSDATIARAIDERRRGYQVSGNGIVVRQLADDNDGSRHQRFIVRIGSGQTLLVAHNIDLAPRVRGLETGDRVSFFGEYEWNERGGVIHWTHKDPRAQHVDGWLEHNGQRFQ